MRRVLFILVAVALVALAGARAPADAQSTACPDAGNTYVVDTAPEALDIASGYQNTSCTIIIKTSVPIAVPVYKVEAAGIIIQGKDVLDPSKRVELINTNGVGDVELVAQNGDVFIQEAVVKGKNNVTIDCNNPATCDVTILDSEVMAPLSVLDPSDGNVRVHARDDVRIENSTLFGGNFLYITSDQGGIVWHCGSGVSACTPPSQSGVAAQLCPTFPCTPTFQNIGELDEVCSPAFPVFCGGGSKEIRITALLDIDISGSAITGLDHVTFTSKTGKIDLSKAVLEAENFNFNAETGIDMREAKITVTGHIAMESKGGCPDPALGLPANPPVGGLGAGLCINAYKAQLKAETGNINIIATGPTGLGLVYTCEGTFNRVAPGFPKINNDSNPPYDPFVVDTGAECAPAGPGVFQ